MALADLGRNVRRYMKLQKLSIPQLAEKSGLGTATLSNILNEKASPNSSTLIKISTALGVSFPELLAETPKLKTLRFRTNTKLTEEDGKVYKLVHEPNFMGMAGEGWNVYMDFNKTYHEKMIQADRFDAVIYYYNATPIRTLH